MGLFGKKRKQEQEPNGMSGKKGLLKRLRREKPWIYRGVVLSLVFSVAFSCFYGVFRSVADKYEQSPLEEADNIAWLYQNCYLLYRDLYNAQREEELDYANLYLEAEEGYGWILDVSKRGEYSNLLTLLLESGPMEEAVSQGELPEKWLEEAIAQGLLSEAQMERYVEQGLIGESQLKEYEDSEDSYNLNLAQCNELEKEMEQMEVLFRLLEDNFPNLNSCYDYIIEDHVTGKYITNMSAEDRERSARNQYFQLSFSFDSAGNVSIVDEICGRDVDQIRKLANEAVRGTSLQGELKSTMETFDRYGKIKGPVDCTVTFAVSMDAWESRREGGMGLYIGTIASEYGYGTDIHYYATSLYHDYSASAYHRSGLDTLVVVSMFCIVLLGAFLPLAGSKPWRDERICAVSLELLSGVVLMLLGACDFILRTIVYVASGRAGGAFSDYLGISQNGGEELAMAFNVAVLALFSFCCWYVGVCARALRELGVKKYIKQRSLIYRFFPFIKRKAVEYYDSLAHMDLTRDSNKTIVKLLVMNAAILFLISCFWIGGFAITLVYSIVLYFILRRYISELQKRYRILLKAVDEIAEGNLNVTIQEDLGVFEPFREQVFKIQEGLQKAVDTEVRSQRMKVELVTNMSHDLKTPLTAIITYVNLLKEKDITEEQRREYLATLESRSLRLKSLIEDLFEFSKASSQNVTLNIMDVDIMNLVKQVAFEMSDKMGAANLDVRMNLTDEKVILPLDSQKTYRIYENLFGNIAKYALPGTRVYVNGFRIDDTVVITLKNISAQEITVDSSELTERFVRGDASRNTEGSGLGLAIAKSFMELQGGLLHLEVDGDLFKASTTWYIRSEQDYPEALPNSQ